LRVSGRDRHPGQPEHHGRRGGHGHQPFEAGKTADRWRPPHRRRLARRARGMARPPPTRVASPAWRAAAGRPGSPPRRRRDAQGPNRAKSPPCPRLGIFRSPPSADLEPWPGAAGPTPGAVGTVRTSGVVCPRDLLLQPIELRALLARWRIFLREEVLTYRDPNDKLVAVELLRKRPTGAISF